MKEVSTISKRKSRSRPQNRRQQPRPVNKGYGDAGASWHKKATKGFRAMSGSPKEDIDANNYTLRQRARMLYMAAPIATSAIRTNRTNVVGIGLQLKSRIDREALGMTQEAADAWQAQAEREFALWSENKRACDATGVNNFAAMQQLALSSWLVSGDVFAVVKQYEPTPLTPYSLRLHLIEADRVATPTTSGIITPMLLTTGKADSSRKFYPRSSCFLENKNPSGRTIAEAKRLVALQTKPYKLLDSQRILDLFVGRLSLIADKAASLLQKRRGKLHQRRKRAQCACRQYGKLSFPLLGEVLNPSCVHIYKIPETKIACNTIKRSDLLLDRIDKKGLAARHDAKGDARKPAARSQVGIKTLGCVADVRKPR